jgi:hypothetical protein
LTQPIDSYQCWAALNDVVRTADDGNGLSSFGDSESSSIREYVQGYHFVGGRVDSDLLGTLQFGVMPVCGRLVCPVKLGGRGIQPQAMFGQKIDSKDHTFIQI